MSTPPEEIKPEPAPKINPGWWSTGEMPGGSVAGVSSALDAIPEIPNEWKAAIKAEILRECTGDLNSVKVDAHATTVPGKFVLNVDISATKML